MSKKARYEHYEPGNLIKKQLMEKGMRQNELAEIINMSPATINDIVSGKRGMTPNIIIRVCLALGLDPFVIGRAYSDYAIKEEMKLFMHHIKREEGNETTA